MNTWQFKLGMPKYVSRYEDSTFYNPFKANKPNEAALPPTRPPTRMKMATTEATSLSSGSILGFRAGEEERIKALVL